MSLEAFHRGIRLFNQQNFYDAHEVWEDVWRETHGPEKKFLQGLIQVAVALHHQSTGNLAGARSLLNRARKNLDHNPGPFGDIGLAVLLDSLAKWRDSLSSGSPRPAFPRIHKIE